MKKLTIISILCVAIFGLVGCYSTTSFNSYNEEVVIDTLAAEELEPIIVEETKVEEEKDTFEYGKVVYDTQFTKARKGVEKIMLVKMINENEIEELGDYIIVDGVVYTNPKNNPNIDIKALGFKEFFIDDIPSYDEETQKVERYYYDGGTTIHRAWRVINKTKEEIALVESIK